MKLAEKYWVLADQVVVSGSAFATNLLLARALGIAQYGIFSGLVLVQLLVLSLLQASITGLAPVLLAHIGIGEKRSYTGGLFWFHQAILTLLFVAGILFFLFADTMWAVGRNIGIAAVVGACLYFMQDYLRRWLLATQQQPKAFAIDVLTNVVQLLALAVLFFVYHLDLLIALWVVALTYIPSVALGVWWLKPGVPIAKDIRSVALLHARDGKWMLSSALLQWTAGNFYVMAAGWWLGAAALGALRLGQYIFGLLNVLLQAFETYILPKAAHLHQEPAALVRFLRKQFLQLSVLLIPVLILLAVFGKPLLHMAGGDTYTSYSYVMIGLAILYVFILFGYPVRIALRVQLLNKFYFYGYVLATIFSVATAYFMIHFFQLWGALAGMLLAQCMLLVYWLYILYNKNIRV
ncbi:lipopolysaccharide biosynthesis protein [Phnomibacter ginsenosidimutans]|uniref:Oligosaccharide flippase family protein n=1 Tax=Phnomibacter ginsenosidimutans TaxID=2676868 RepID=A0A6I6G4G3_9BACT|nr:hypothetical protein [Phnomibacter ginsenosidimutans]QGW26947.1 hypothetical protein GLV81_01485 [Phnomibacter ginsenosidimutans]